MSNRKVIISALSFIFLCLYAQMSFGQYGSEPRIGEILRDFHGPEGELLLEIGGEEEIEALMALYEEEKAENPHEGASAVLSEALGPVNANRLSVERLAPQIEEMAVILAAGLERHYRAFSTKSSRRALIRRIRRRVQIMFFRHQALANDIAMVINSQRDIAFVFFAYPWAKWAATFAYFFMQTPIDYIALGAVLAVYQFIPDRFGVAYLYYYYKNKKQRLSLEEQHGISPQVFEIGLKEMLRRKENELAYWYTVSVDSNPISIPISFKYPIPWFGRDNSPNGFISFNDLYKLLSADKIKILKLRARSKYELGRMVIDEILNSSKRDELLEMIQSVEAYGEINQVIAKAHELKDQIKSVVVSIRHDLTVAYIPGFMLGAERRQRVRLRRQKEKQLRALKRRLQDLRIDLQELLYHWVVDWHHLFEEPQGTAENLEKLNSINRKRQAIEEQLFVLNTDVYSHLISPERKQALRCEVALFY